MLSLRFATFQHDTKFKGMLSLRFATFQHDKQMQSAKCVSSKIVNKYKIKGGCKKLGDVTNNG